MGNVAQFPKHVLERKVLVASQYFCKHEIKIASSLQIQSLDQCVVLLYEILQDQRERKMNIYFVT